MPLTLNAPSFTYSYQKNKRIFVCAQPSVFNHQLHSLLINRLRELPPRFLSCEAVLTESCLRLGFDSRAVEQIGPLTFCPTSPVAAGGLLRR